MLQTRFVVILDVAVATQIKKEKKLTIPRNYLVAKEREHHKGKQCLIELLAANSQRKRSSSRRPNLASDRLLLPHLGSNLRVCSRCYVHEWLCHGLRAPHHTCRICCCFRQRRGANARGFNHVILGNLSSAFGSKKLQCNK